MTATTSTSRIDASCRLPLFMLFGGAAMWLALGSVFGLIASLKFHLPAMFANCAWLSYGRAYPAWSHLLVYGFCIPAGYLQGLHQSTDIGEVIINKTFWNKLPPDIQEIVRTAALASMMETYTYNVYRNAQAVVKLRNDFKVQILDTPKDFFPEFVRATNVVLDRYSGKDAFFKQVLDSQRKFAVTVVPYWTKILDLYSNLGNAALKSAEKAPAKK